MQRVYIAWNGKLKPCAAFFPGRISKCGQRPFDTPTKGLQGSPKIHSSSLLLSDSQPRLIFVCTFAKRTYIVWNWKLKPCEFFSWKNFKVRTAHDRHLYKGPTRATKDIISLIFIFRLITPFDIRLHHNTACVYSIEREIEAMRIFFLEEFQSADSARSTALQKASKGHQRYNLYHVYFPIYNPV